MLEKHSAGQNIDSYCGRCRLNLEHTIMLMDGDAIAKVRCKSCGSSHKFRSPLEAQKVPRPRAKKGAGEEATAEIIWEAGLAGASGQERDYDRSAQYGIGDVVNHQTFGKGIVTKVFTDKCEMLFKDKERLMASANH